MTTAMQDDGTPGETSTPTLTERSSIGPGALIALASLSALAPFGTDLYLSAFPTMVTDLSTTTTGVQLSLTAFLVGAGVGQLVFGPWSDRAGRMIPLLTGMVVFVIASAVTVVAPDVTVLTAARAVQGLGGAAGMVLGRAIIVDRQGDDATGALNIMMSIGGVAPVVAPLAGSLLADSIGWRALLAIVGVLALLSLALTLVFVRESLPKPVRDARAAEPGPRHVAALSSRAYVGHAVAFAFTMATLMSYISASPFVYQDMMGLSTLGYGIAFAVNAIGLGLSSLAAAWLAHRVATRTVVVAALSVTTVATLVVTAFTITGAPAGWLMVPLFAAIAPLGLILGNTTALALGAVPERAMGTASAVLGVAQFVLAGIVAGLVGIAGEDTTLPLAVLMLTSVAIIWIALVAVRPSPATYRTSATPR